MKRYLFIATALLFISCENPDYSTTTIAEQEDRELHDLYSAPDDHYSYDPNSITNLIASRKRARTYNEYVGIRDDFSGYVNGMVDPPKVPCHNYTEPKAEAAAESENVFTTAIKDGYSATYDWIAKNLKGGKYKFTTDPKKIKQKKTADDHDDICRVINTIIDDKDFDKKGKSLVPQVSDCTYASYIGMIIMLKKNNPAVYNKRKSHFRCSLKKNCDPAKSKSRCYSYSKDLRIFASNESMKPKTFYPSWLKENLGKGNYKKFTKHNVTAGYKKGFPKKGDLVNLWRSSRKGGSLHGHNVLFSGLKDEIPTNNLNIKGRSQKKVKCLCYWSSNYSPKPGQMDEKCEDLSLMHTITVGKL